MFSSTLIALSLAASAFGAIFVTSPTATTTCAAGQPCTVSWIDDGTQPSLPSFGNAMLSVYTGNANQQTQLQLVQGSVNVGSTQSVVFNPDATMGSNGDMYFMRFQSLALPDPTNAQFPALGFSAKFTLSGMTGTFNSSVASEIAGTTTAPIGTPATSTSGSAGSPSSTASGLSTSHVSSSTSTASSTAKSATSSSNGAEMLTFNGAAGFFGLAATVLGLVL